MNDFEEILQRQSFRPVPPDWRAEILGAAPAPASSAASPSLKPWWCAWLWPCPQAWAGLAVVWVLIVLVHLETQTTAERLRLAHRPSEFTPREWVASLAEQRQLLQDLFRETACPPAPPLPPLAPAERGACLDPRRRTGVALA